MFIAIQAVCSLFIKLAMILQEIFLFIMLPLPVYVKINALGLPPLLNLFYFEVVAKSSILV